MEVPKKYNFIPPAPNMQWPFQNSSWEVYKLYCMIVVPKELYNLAESDSYYTDLVKKDVMHNFNIKKQRKLLKNQRFTTSIPYVTQCRTSII